eukprot:GEMP01010324.1.p1 GENE.GEMP01010324.1~~GEMP01010324.1.p1  ORF type:complete len:530 (+),score=92.50 GEMP01010324.1:1-1590(+)
MRDDLAIIFSNHVPQSAYISVIFIYIIFWASCDTTQTLAVPKGSGVLRQDTTDIAQRQKGTEETGSVKTTQKMETENPDHWVPRNSRAWRHGKWNQETPINDLEEHGFVTPNDLFFIRSHGPVPRLPVDAREHGVEFSGNLSSETLTLADLQDKFPVVNLWSCLVCSGQRRYELNLIKKGVGHIDWHNAIGNAVWTGVLLRDVLLYLNVDQDPAKSQHVEFFGHDDYRTSTAFHKCMDPSGDVLLAWLMNNEPLPPDHGAPLRIVIPGYSSKCSCKWVKKISVQQEETTYHMHHRYYKWFPPHLTNSTTQLEEMLAVPPLTELNTNCVIFQPRNNARVKKGPLKVNGYAFTGGGRPLARAEISLDGGDNWLIATLRQEFTSSKKMYSWVRWEVTVDFDPNEHKEIICRAWDAAANGMCENPVWNLTGMMNNCWFRVKTKNSRFQHPTTWMNKEAPPKQEFAWKAGDFEALNGEWEPGDNLPCITLKVGCFLDGSTVEVKFGPFFTVRGEVTAKGIEWKNGATWYKMAQD